jgi:hypothetical protein
MQSKKPVFILILLVVVMGAAILFFPKPTANKADIDKGKPDADTAKITATATPSEIGKFESFYLVTVGDAGKGGKAIGCGDSLVQVLTADCSKAGIECALNNLFSIKTQTYGESGLYNALYQSKLKLDNIATSNGKTTIHISGQVVLGGACDNPRFFEQINETVKHYYENKPYEILINGKTLQSVVSLK